MDFRLNEEQQMLQDTVARLVRGEYSFEKRLEYSESELGFSADFWKQLGELGLTAVPFPEELGGFGGSGVEVQSVMTELGRGLCIEPYLQSVVLSGGLISQAGNAVQHEQWLGGIASGEMRMAFRKKMRAAAPSTRKRAPIPLWGRGAASKRSS